MASSDYVSTDSQGMVLCEACDSCWPAHCEETSHEDRCPVAELERIEAAYEKFAAAFNVEDYGSDEAGEAFNELWSAVTGGRL